MEKQEYFEVGDFAKMTAENIDKIAEKWGENFAKEIKTNQIRNVFSSIAAIRNDFVKSKRYTDEIQTNLIMLKPKLAYAVGRSSGKAQEKYRRFKGLLEEAIDKITGSNDHKKAMENFFFLAEALVAYHKYYGGRD